MMAPKQFYVTLPSSASLDIYPENTLAHYITELNRAIDFDIVDYEVGLCEFQLDSKIYNVPDEVIAFSICRSKYSVRKIKSHNHENLKLVIINGAQFYRADIVLPAGYYSDGTEIANIFNKQLSAYKLTEGIVFHYIKKNGARQEHSYIFEMRLNLRHGNMNKSNFKMEISDKLSTVMVPTEERPDVDGKYNYLYYTFNLDKVVSPPKLCYIYTNIVEFQYVGDTESQLLRIVEIENPEYRSTVNIIFTSPHFIPVRERILNKIEIDIRTVEGKPFPFVKGQLNLVLLFRERV